MLISPAGRDELRALWKMHRDEIMAEWKRQRGSGKPWAEENLTD